MTQSKQQATQPREPATDLSYYLGVVEPGAIASEAVEVTVSEDGDNSIVTVDFKDGNGPAASDLIGFFEQEKLDIHYWFTIAIIFFNRGSVDQAFEVANATLAHFERTPSISNAQAFVAWLYIRLSKETGEVGVREESLKSANDLVKAALLSSTHPGLVRLAQAEIHYQNKNFDQAYDIYDRIIKTETHKTIIAYASIGKAKILFMRKNLNHSLKQFQAVLIENPALKPDPRLGIGLNFWALKDKSLAVKAWQRVLELDPENESAKVLLLLSKFDSSFNSVNDEKFVETYSAALESLQALKIQFNKNPVLLLLIASYHYTKGDYDTVLTAANKVLSLPSISSNVTSDAQFWIARVFYIKGDFTSAQKHFTESLKSNEDNLLAKLGVGQSQIKRGNLEESIITFEGIYSKTSKILEVDYILGVLYSQKEQNHSKAIELLERYVRLSNDSNEQIYLNAFYTLSRLYEKKVNSKSLDYLSKALELLRTQGEAIPIEILNNMGVLHFVQGNPESAQTFFDDALASNSREDLDITLTYNSARSKETTDMAYSKSKYEEILSKIPGYVNAKLRLLFLNIMNSGSSDDMNAKIEELLTQTPSNLSVRSFYSWFLKRVGKSASSQNKESTHNKETLVKYDSHDTYALLSLGNLYCTIAREIKSTKQADIEKRNQSYIRGAQLFQKVLSIDPHNVFAAQGIAIIFAENGYNSIALETFRKIRDSVDDVSVYVNLGHCLTEVNQYSKAIESYEIALKRYGDETKDSKLLTLVARAWFLRGVSEKSIESFTKALEYSIKSLEVAKVCKYSKLIPSLQYNVAFVQFNIAQFTLKQKIEQRVMKDLETSLSGLREAIATFEKLSELDVPPIQANILKQRASMGTNTLVKQLERSINEQKEYEITYQSKIEEAQRKREEEKQRAVEEENKKRDEEEKLQQTKREEYLRLQEQAKEWERERESYEVVEEPGEKKKRRSKKNAILTDEESSSDEDVQFKKKANKRKKKGTTIVEDENAAKKRKVDQSKFKSSEFVADSDDDSDEQMLDEENEEDDLEAAESKIDATKNTEEDEEDDDGLF